MSDAGPLDPRYLDDLRAVLERMGYHLIKREECLAVGARVMLSNEEQMVMKREDLHRYLMGSLTRKIAHELVKVVEPKLLPQTGDAEVYELRLTLLKTA